MRADQWGGRWNSRAVRSPTDPVFVAIRKNGRGHTRRRRAVYLENKVGIKCIDDDLTFADIWTMLGFFVAICYHLIRIKGSVVLFLYVQFSIQSL